MNKELKKLYKRLDRIKETYYIVIGNEKTDFELIDICKYNCNNFVSDVFGLLADKKIMIEECENLIRELPF